MENNLANIRIFLRTFVFIPFSPHGTTLMALIQMSVYQCLQMLDGFLSSHPTDSKACFASLLKALPTKNIVTKKEKSVIALTPACVSTCCGGDTSLGARSVTFEADAMPSLVTT